MPPENENIIDIVRRVNQECDRLLTGAPRSRIPKVEFVRNKDGMILLDDMGRPVMRYVSPLMEDNLYRMADVVGRPASVRLSDQLECGKKKPTEMFSIKEFPNINFNFKN